MGFNNSKFRVTTKAGGNKIVNTFNRPSSVDRFIKESRKLKKTFPFKNNVTHTIDVIRKGKVTGSKKITIR